MSFTDSLNTELDIRTVELPWLDNQRRVSCYPAGEYDVHKRYKKTVSSLVELEAVRDEVNRSIPEPKGFPSILYLNAVTSEYYWVPGTTKQNFGWHYHVQNVPNRSGILFHPANYVFQLQGCTAPGLSHTDLNKDGVIDVTNSRLAMQKMLTVLGDRFKLIVQ